MEMNGKKIWNVGGMILIRGERNYSEENLSQYLSSLD